MTDLIGYAVCGPLWALIFCAIWRSFRFKGKLIAAVSVISLPILYSTNSHYGMVIGATLWPSFLLAILVFKKLAENEEQNADEVRINSGGRSVGTEGLGPSKTSAESAIIGPYGKHVVGENEPEQSVFQSNSGARPEWWGKDE